MIDFPECDQPVDLLHVGQQRLGMAHHVLGHAATMGSCRAFAVDVIGRVGKGQVAVLFVDQRDIAVSGVQQAADHLVHGGVEGIEAVRGAGQFGDSEQRGLQSLAALSLQHLLAQNAVGIAQRGRTIGDAATKFDMRFAPLHARSAHAGRHS